MKKKPNPNSPKPVTPEPGYLDLSKQRQATLATYGQEVIDSFGRATASLPIDHEVVSDVHVRQGFGRGDYEYFRPTEKLPTKFSEIVEACRGAYEQVGVVRNVVDLLTDLATEGLRFVDKSKDQEVFYRIWSQKVQLMSAAEEFARHALIDCNVVCKRVTARLGRPAETQMLAKAEPDLSATKDPRLTTSREIPWRYHFLDVTKLKWAGGAGTLFSDARRLVFQVPRELLSLVKEPKTELDKEIRDGLPKDFIQQIESGKGQTIELDNAKLFVYQSKKDSWKEWATPFMYAVLPDILFKYKLRQADISALDGVINVIRIWKLGDHKEGILPNAAAVEKLLDILKTNTGGGAMDIVWDSMLEMKDYYPPVDKILGGEKYVQVDADIKIGLGVPEVLLGGKGANFSNSFIQLAVVMERIKAIRAALIRWLTTEMAIVAEAMGFSGAPRIVFNNMNLEDPSSYRKLVVGLIDRGLVSPQAVLEAYGEDFEIEIERAKDQIKAYEKAGLDILSPFDPKQTPAGSGPGGRPAGTKDSSKRSTRTPSIRTSAKLAVTAENLLRAFDEHIVPEFLASKELENSRKLSAAQRQELAELRLYVLASSGPNDPVSYEALVQRLSEPQRFNQALASHLKAEVSALGREATLAETLAIEKAAWAAFYEVV